MDLFKRGPAMGFRLIILIALSLTIMVLDHREQQMQTVRQGLSLLVTPIQYVVDMPLRFADWVSESFSSHRKLLEENTQLKTQELLLRGQVQKFYALEKENRQLRALLQSSPRVEEKVVSARLLAVDANRYVHQYTLGKGSRQGVYVGQAVLDANGVLGQVIRVTPLTSTVLLLIDSRSAIPVENSRNGIRGIVTGTGELNSLALIDVPRSADVKAGDVLMSSGLGQRFPAGYPVGVVSSVIANPGEHFAQIKVTPSAQFNRGRIVLLVLPKSTEAEPKP